MVGMGNGVSRSRDGEPASAKPETLEEAVSKVLADIKDKLYQDPFANRWSVIIRADNGRICDVSTEVIRRLAGHPDFEVTEFQIDYSKDSMSLAISKRKPKPGDGTFQEASKLPTSDVPTLQEIRESDRARDWLEIKARTLCENALAMFSVSQWTAEPWPHAYMDTIANAELAKALAPAITAYITKKNYQLQSTFERVTYPDNSNSENPVNSALRVCLRSTAPSPS